LFDIPVDTRVRVFFKITKNISVFNGNKIGRIQLYPTILGRVDSYKFYRYFCHELFETMENKADEIVSLVSLPLLTIILLLLNSLEYNRLYSNFQLLKIDLMNFKKILLAFACLLLTAKLTNAQNIASYPAPTKLLFPSKGKEILAAHGDTLLLINSLPNRKELWVYRASTDSAEKYKAEIFYKPHPFAFSANQIAFYDIIMNRFIFSTLENNATVSYMGDKLKGVGEASIGLSLPRFYFFNNHWFVLSLAGFAYMDNKLFYGILTNEGTWAIPPGSIFEYPEGLSQNFGLIKAYTAATLNGKQVVCSEVSGTHPIAKENNLPNGLFVLTEFNESFAVSRQIPITNQGDSALLSRDIPNVLELVSIGNDRLAMVVKSEKIFCAKIFSEDYKLVKQVPIAEGTSVLKSTSAPISGGFVSVFCTSEYLAVAYITKEGLARKRWRIYDAKMDTVDFYCMNDKDNLYVIIKDSQKDEVIRKAISISDLEK